jgi:hypothetical protein
MEVNAGTRVAASSSMLGMETRVRPRLLHADVVATALLLDDSHVGLVVALLNRRSSDVLPLLSHAREMRATGTRWADQDGSRTRPCFVPFVNAFT